MKSAPTSLAFCRREADKSVERTPSQELERYVKEEEEPEAGIGSLHVCTGQCTSRRGEDSLLLDRQRMIIKSWDSLGWKGLQLSKLQNALVVNT